MGTQMHEGNYGSDAFPFKTVDFQVPAVSFRGGSNTKNTFETLLMVQKSCTSSYGKYPIVFLYIQTVGQLAG